MENISGIDTAATNALLSNVARKFEELFITLAPIAKAYHTYLSQDMPRTNYLSIASNIRDDHSNVIPFHNFELDFLDPTEGYFIYTAPHKSAFFMIPYAYAENPEVFVAECEERLMKAYVTVNEAYAKFAPLAAEKHPEMFPYIHAIDDTGSTAYVYITEGDAKSVTLIDPSKEALRANIFQVDLSTGEITCNQMT